MENFDRLVMAHAAPERHEPKPECKTNLELWGKDPIAILSKAGFSTGQFGKLRRYFFNRQAKIRDSRVKSGNGHIGI